MTFTVKHLKDILNLMDEDHEVVVASLVTDMIVRDVRFVTERAHDNRVVLYFDDQRGTLSEVGDHNDLMFEVNSHFRYLNSI